MKENLLHYHEAPDLYRSLAVDLITEFLSTDTIRINDTVEAINACNTYKYLCDGLRSINWTDDYITTAKSKAKTAKKEAVEYMKSNIVSIVTKDISSSPNLRSEFFRICSEEKLYKQIPPEIFRQILNKDSIADILKYTNIVKAFAEIIHTFLLNEKETTYHLLKNSHISFTKAPPKYNFPSRFTEEERKQIYRWKLNAPDADFSDMQFILAMKRDLNLTSSEMQLASDKNRKLLEYNYDKQDKAMNDIGFGLKFISGDPAPTRSYSVEGKNHYIVLSSDYILNNLAPDKLITLFSSYLAFSTNNGTIPSSNRTKQTLLMDGLTPKFDFCYNMQFQQFYMLKSAIAITGYVYEAATEKGICFEKLLESAFRFQLARLGIDADLCYSLPLADMSFRDKNKCIFSEVEALLRKYSIMFELGKLDLNVFEMGGIDFPYGSVKSCFNTKYYVPAEDEKLKAELEWQEYLLFGNQLTFSVNNIPDTEKNNFELFTNQNISFDSLTHDHEKEKVKWLISKHCLYNDSGYLKPTAKAYLIWQLWEQDAISAYHLSDYSFYSALTKMISDREVVPSPYLLTKNESDFLNFLMKDKYGDGLGLRNRAAHGYLPNDEEENKYIYFYFLYVIISLTIKIVDELDFWSKDMAAIKLQEVMK